MAETKTRMVPMGEYPHWYDLGLGPMVLTAVKGDCEFGTGEEEPDYSSDGGLPIPAAAPIFIYTEIRVWARRVRDAVEAEIIFGPL